eukprot:gnl/TRDRNA2_/TRDRNA2_33279_c0_seq1.p1 gnl/TRDRNA2_/TRDRNA2_33279_c0~~gnl/TRDRNA2_/TRDRNA2_33279_c0_seq1.p1  ORF type:complete len:556 (-),score=77.68 gnl/TRDRNA2_/TRDRNA2_33279_c0_seq1:12-1505(-)
MTSVVHTSSHYELLGVSPAASLAELLSAFVRLGVKAHPSSGGSACEFDQVVKALEVLADPFARKRYDAVLARRAAMMTSASLVADTAAPSQQFLEQLHDLLQQLPPAERREIIAKRLTSGQRRHLECWMLAERMRLSSKEHMSKLKLGSGASSDGNFTCVKPQGCSASVRPPEVALSGGSRPSLSLRSLGSHKTRRGCCGYRPTAHVDGGLYCQAAFTYDLQTAVAALGTLIIARSSCRAAASAAAGAAAAAYVSECKADPSSVTKEVVATFCSFEGRLRAAFCRALSCCVGPQPKLYFRTRVAAPKRTEFSTPMCSDLDTALLDRQGLRKACDVWASALPQSTMRWEAPEVAATQARIHVDMHFSKPRRLQKRRVRFTKHVPYCLPKQPCVLNEKRLAGSSGSSGEVRLLRSVNRLLQQEQKRQDRLYQRTSVAKGQKERVTCRKRRVGSGCDVSLGNSSKKCCVAKATTASRILSKAESSMTAATSKRRPSEPTK